MDGRTAPYKQLGWCDRWTSKLSVCSVPLPPPTCLLYDPKALCSTFYESLYEPQTCHQYPTTMQRIAHQKDQECAYANARMAAIAVALQGKYGLIRSHDSLELIYGEFFLISARPPFIVTTDHHANMLLFLVLTADCLLNPGAKRLTAFDIHISAVVYSAMSRPGMFQISHTYRNFIAYDLVALFSSPSTFPPGSSPNILSPPSHWLTALHTLEKRAAEPGRGGHESLISIFADDTAINALVRSSIAMNPASPTTMPSAAHYACSPRVSSFALMHSPMDRRLSTH